MADASKPSFAPKPTLEKFPAKEYLDNCMEKGYVVFTKNHQQCTVE